MFKHYYSKVSLVILGLTLTLTACTQSAPRETGNSARAMPFNIVSTGDSQADVLSARTFDWMPGMQHVREDPRLGELRIQELLRESVTLVLADKGYLLDPDDGKSDLLVGYIVTLDDSQEGQELAEHYGVQASINLASPDPARYEKGTLIIDIIERRTGLTAWRSALQGFASLDISEAERRSRFHAMVKRMLAGMPTHSSVQ